MYDSGFSEESREERAAKNQSLFREMNERLKKLNVSFAFAGPIGDWICECASERCVERVALSLDEYEAVREDGAHFFVAPGMHHVWPDVEEVVERNDRYWVVVKKREAGASAEQADRQSHADPLTLRT
jgi:hypothetical protein